MDKVRLPDIQDGFMVLNHDRKNRWTTPIECLLVRKKDGENESRSYLGHECRAELVGEDPFSHPGGNYEHVSLCTWAGNYYIRSGFYSLGFKLSRKHSRKYSKETYQKIDFDFRVSCTDREVHYLPFEDLISLLQKDFIGGYRKIYMEITFQQSGFIYKVYTLCRYINFPNPEKEKVRNQKRHKYENENYLQPISGYVLYEDNDHFYVAYVVAFVLDGVAKSVQFKIRDTIRMKRKGFFHIITEDFHRNVKFNDNEIDVKFFYYL